MDTANSTVPATSAGNSTTKHFSEKPWHSTERKHSSSETLVPPRTVVNILQTMVMLTALYVLVVLIIYERHYKHSSLATLVKGTVRAAAAKSAAKFGKWLRRLCILGAGFCFLSCVNDLVYYNVKLGSHEACTILQIIGVSLLTDLDTTVYIFLWLRQYAVYQNLRLQNKAVVFLLSVIKWTVLFLIIALCIAMNGLLLRYRRHLYNTSSEICDKVESPIDDLFTHLWTAGSVTLQIILVGLFVFPLIRHSLSYGRRTKGTSPKPSSCSGTRNRMVSLVRRCLIITGLCVGTDIIIMLLTERLLVADEYRQLRPLLYNVNILFNLVVIVMSFKEWKDMLFFARSGKALRKLFQTKQSHVCSSTADIPMHSFVSSTKGIREITCKNKATML